MTGSDSSAAPEDDDRPESAVAVLEAVLEDTPDPALERVRRDQSGQPAYPRARDLVATIPATDGVVALEIRVPRVGDVVVRDASHADQDLPTDYQVAYRQDRDPVSTPAGYHAVTNLVKQHGGDVVLEWDRRHLFADADRLEPPADRADQGEIWLLRH